MKTVLKLDIQSQRAMSCYGWVASLQGCSINLIELKCLCQASTVGAGLALAHKRRSPSGFEHFLWVQVAVKLDQLPY